MRARRWRLNVCGALIAILAVFASAPLAAAEITLDAPRRAALAGLPGLAGDAAAAETLDGEVVVVAFWASWCPPCHPEFDHLNAAAERYADDGVKILAVNIFEEFGPFKGLARRDAFLAKKAPRFTVLADGEKIAACSARSSGSRLCSCSVATAGPCCISCTKRVPRRPM